MPRQFSQSLIRQLQNQLPLPVPTCLSDHRAHGTRALLKHLASLPSQNVFISTKQSCAALGLARMNCLSRSLRYLLQNDLVMKLGVEREFVKHQTYGHPGGVYRITPKGQRMQAQLEPSPNLP